MDRFGFILHRLQYLDGEYLMTSIRRVLLSAMVAAVVTTVPLLVVATSATSATTSHGQRWARPVPRDAAVDRPSDPLSLARAKASVQPPPLPPLAPGEIRVPSVGADMIPVPTGYAVTPQVSVAPGNRGSGLRSGLKEHARY